MKTILSTLKGIALSDCLNEIVKKYTSFQGPGGFVQKTDSMFHFAQLAYNEANKIGYKRGIVVSLLNMARSKQYSMRKGQEEYVRPALKIAEEIKDDHLIGEAYYLLAGVENQADNYKKAIGYFQRAGDVQQETEVTTWLCMSYSNTGEYENALPYCDKCLTLAQQNVKKDTSQWGHELVQWSYWDMAEIYKAAGDYETAMFYLFKSNHYAESVRSGWQNYLDISELYLRMKKYDSAFFYWDKWKKNWDSYAWGHKAYGNTVLAQIYLGTNQAEKIIPLLR
ncbi:MAG TPA: tetratricopeptide repeat protein, partial [Chitinophagaceae bacterium]|nr:tetratricopeptide repeat protein [Chitinophagaceae bacterium]